MTDADQHAGHSDANQSGTQLSIETYIASPGSRWVRPSTFWCVTAVLLAVLLLLIPLMDNSSAAVPDDGVYAAQALALANGSWSQERPAAAIDADGLNSAVRPSFVWADRQIPYLRHPLFPSLLGVLYTAGGFAGMLVLSVVGTWIAAVAAGLMTRKVNPALGVVALLLTGLGSPLLFDAYIVSAHGIAAGLCGLLALGIAQVVDDRRWWPLLYALPCAALLINMRSEGLVAVVAIGVVTGLMALHPRGRPRVDRHGAVAAAATVMVAAAAFLADVWWTQSIKAATNAPVQSVVLTVVETRDPAAAAWISLLRPWYGDGQEAQPLLVLGVVSTVFAAVALRVTPKRWLLPVTLLLTASACLASSAVLEPNLVSGFFAAFPLSIAGLILLSRSELRVAGVRRNLGGCVLATIGITATAYSVGGAVEWGGRFYHLLIPLLVPAVVVGLHRGWSLLPPWPGRIAVAAATAGALALSFTGLSYLRLSREISKKAVAVALEFADESGRDRTPERPPKSLLIVGMLVGDGTSRMFWEPSPNVDVVSSAGIHDLFTIIDRARLHGYGSVSVITNIPPISLNIVGDKRLDGTGWELLELAPITNTPFGLAEFGPASGH